MVGSIERKRVEKKPPKLYDLTTLQREANRYYGLTASQTLQALQELYEEKLVTYPRTDSQFVTEDMRKTVESLVLALDGAAADVSCVINNSKVTDHHAILPTMQSVKCSKEKLSETKQRILSLIIWKLLLAVQPHQVEQAQQLLLAGGDLACLVGEVVEARPDGKALVLR